MYTRDLKAAARRHNNAGEELFGGHRNDVAGYLFGIAAECAFKAMMLRYNFPPSGSRYDDPFYAHFQELKAMALERLKGRYSGRLRNFCERSDFMQYWDITMRYSNGKEVQPQWIERWRTHASEIIAAMDEA